MAALFARRVMSALSPTISVKLAVQPEVRRDLAHLMPLIGKDEAGCGSGGAPARPVRPVRCT
jgi:hypothetical protein